MPYDRYGRYEPFKSLTTREKVRTVSNRIIGTVAVLAAVGTAVFGIGAGIRAIAGSYGPRFPKGEAQTLNMERYKSVFQHASPAGKFVMEYLRQIDVDYVEYPDAHGQSADSVEVTPGISGGGFWQTRVGNACLSNTAYEIASGKIDFNVTYSLFSFVTGSTSGSEPTATAFAEVDPSNPDDLLVHSGIADSVTLTFSGLDNKDTRSLTPANKQTEDILSTYGCSIAPSTSGVVI